MISLKSRRVVPGLPPQGEIMPGYANSRSADKRARRSCEHGAAHACSPYCFMRGFYDFEHVAAFISAAMTVRLECTEV